MEEEAQARAHAMLHRESSFSNSASSLAHQLSSSIEDKPFEPERPAPIRAPILGKKSLSSPVQSKETANLIA